jgi:hypothetical protein
MNREGGTPILASPLRSVIVISARSFPAGVAVLTLSSLYCVLPLLTHKSIPAGHDTGFHIFQSIQFLQGLGDGSFYPRWAADANNGYGSPNFVFYAPIPYYLVGLVNLLEPSIVMSMVYVIWAGFFLSGMSMFIAARRMFGNPGSLLAAVVYQMLPFHLIDLYHRGTFAELLAYSWLPLFFYFLMKSRDSRESRTTMVGLSLVYAALILTHLVTGFIFTVVAGGFLLYGIFLPGEKKPLLKTIASLLVGLGISAVYLGPAVLERKYVHLNILLKGQYYYTGNYLFDFREHLYEIFYRFLNITAILEVSFFIWIVLLSKKMMGKMMREDPNRFLVLAFVGSFFLTTPLSRPVWDLVPQFPFLQFPWRWMIVMELSLCFLIADCFSRETAQGYGPARFLKTFIIVILTFFAQLPMQNIHDAAISENNLVMIKKTGQWKILTDEKLEYLPVWTTSLENIGTWDRDDRVVAKSGSAFIQVSEWAPESRTIEVRAASDTVVRISSFYYPGWEVTLDGGITPIDIEKKTGALLVNVPEGDHSIRAIFRDTPLRKISKYTSFGSLFLLIPVTMFLGRSNVSRIRRSRE